jgi:hypothetical protein
MRRKTQKARKPPDFHADPVDRIAVVICSAIDGVNNCVCSRTTDRPACARMQLAAHWAMAVCRELDLKGAGR